MKYKKLIRDGLVAVLISPGFGAGWSTWAEDKEVEGMLFDSRLIEALEKSPDELLRKAGELYPDSYKSVKDVEIQWLPIGTIFWVEEYDGSERIVTTEDKSYTA